MTDITPGSTREVIDPDELRQWRETGTIVTDERRRRPYWFDGRFLDAAALNAEQHYFLARQADYGRAAGFGVIQGLEVSYRDSQARGVRIAPGQGLTPSGAPVALAEALEVDLTAVAERQRLDASFGLAGLPRSPAANRSGLFILALRPVEFSAGPISAYPGSLEGPRASQDGSIVAATAVSLIPYPHLGASSELADRRAQVAREIFLEQSLKGQPDDVLPLAMLALDHGVIRWLDNFMVRREIAQRQRGVWGLGLAPRALRAAHLRQYSDHLEDLLARDGGGAAFVASEHFSVLPPAGPMPVNGIAGDEFRHSFFPAEMEVELSLVPEDELPALLEETLLLPPIDLEMDGQAHGADSVMVLLALPRHEFYRLARRLPSLRRRLAPSSSPAGALEQALLRRPPPEAAADAGDELAAGTWRGLLAGRERLWFVRRRNLDTRFAVAGQAVELPSDEQAVEERAEERAAALKIKPSLKTIGRRASAMAMADLTRFLAAPPVAPGADLAAKAVINELAEAERIDSGRVRAATEKFTRPDFGQGLARVNALSAGLLDQPELLDTLAKSGRVAELDRLGRGASEAALKRIAAELQAAAGEDGQGPQRVARLIDAALDEQARRLGAPV